MPPSFVDGPIAALRNPRFDEYDPDHMSKLALQAVEFSGHPGLPNVPRTLLARAHASAPAAGSVIFRTGDRPGFVHFLIEGEVRLVRHSRRGQEIVLQRVHQGYFAEASVEFRQYHCDAVAAVKSLVLHFPIDDFMVQLDADRRFRHAWLSHLAGEVRRLRARCERLSLRGAAERIVHYIESEGTAGAVELRLPLKRWALELGLTHEALYRALAKLRRERQLAVKGSRIELLGP